MNIKKIIWWVIVIFLLGGSIFFLFGSFDGEKKNIEQHSAFAKSIRDNHEQWKDIKIGGIDPKYYCKNLYINSSLTINFLQFSVYLLLILLMFIAMTNIYKKKQEKKRQNMLITISKKC